MIEFHEEELFSFTEAAKLMPQRRRGRKLAASTLWRWSKKGLRGVHLDSLVVGGQRYTTKTALQRFFAQLTRDADIGARSTSPQLTVNDAAPRASQDIDAELDQARL